MGCGWYVDIFMHADNLYHIFHHIEYLIIEYTFQERKQVLSKIVIDAGHGRYTAGKRCLKSLDPEETREWVLNARVAEALETYLLSAGHETLRVDDTSGETDVPLAARVNMANEWGADYYISIHHNAGINGGNGGGTLVFVYPGTSGITTET